MTVQEIDRIYIDDAIGYIKSSDLDWWVIKYATKALEHWKPKITARKVDKHNNNIFYLYCPRCDNWIGTWNNEVKECVSYNKANKYVCPYCGQTIDWEGMV